ncbi:hypothetical protein K2173_000412 [Erythroxylum novogranatense]|uniref:Uncharacterized protein n=1 Tax=Erythroxylum novogranatense TaxID=1862640 RepID=A0AAV8SW71_9ROSI|nr:hypothetical protein K2173_000412 [Erythroxylum novogranatense]
MRIVNAFGTTTNRATATVEASQPPSTMAQPRSPWHSPLPYLFGGLAAMLGLIAFALLILTCSYWRLSGSLDSSQGGGQRDLESGDQNEEGNSEKVYEEKILVIMAGNHKPTFLATPLSSMTKVVRIEDQQRDKSESSDKVKEHTANLDLTVTMPTRTTATTDYNEQGGETHETHQTQ